MPIRVQCPKCQTMCQVGDQYVNSAVACGKCKSRFVARAPQPAPVPTEIPTAILAEDDDDDIMPGWDEDEVAARLASVQIPQASAPAPTATPGAPATMPATPIIRLDIGASTSSGRVRSRNEDSYVIQQLRWSNRNQHHDVSFVVVADGMGGHDAGDVASGMAIQTMCSTMGPHFTGAIAAAAPPGNLGQVLDNAVRGANQGVHRKAQADPNCRGMGTTLAAAIIWNGQVFISHVGDCRVYHYKSSKLKQITEDQTLVARMVQAGKLTPQEAASHPARNEVAQAVGRQPDISPSAHQLRVGSGEWLIVACDGLHAHVSSSVLENAIRSATAAPPLAIQLVNLANQGGGSDNTTVVAIRCY